MSALCVKYFAIYMITK